MMLDADKLITELSARIDKIVKEEMPQVKEPMVQLLQSTRARALMDVVDALKKVIEENE